MKDILNLQALKYSRNKKHNTIYEKAHRIMKKGFETTEMSEEDILAMAQRFPQLDIRVVIGGDMIVKSKKDVWMIVDEGRFISLYHKKVVFEKGKVKDRYHIQDIFYDLEFTLASIISHDDFALGIEVRDIEGVMQIVANSR